MRFNKILPVAVALAGVAAGQFLPQIQLTPAGAPVGAGDTTLTVSGIHLTPDLQILWNGQPLPTRFTDSRTLKTTIPAGSLANPGLSEVTLANSTGTAASVAVGFLAHVPIQANDLAADSQRSLIYAAVSKLDPNGPSIAVLEPSSGAVDRYVPLPGEPIALTISGDFRYLYAVLPDRVRRLDLTGATNYSDVTLSGLPRYPSGAQETSFVLPFPNQSTSFVVVTAQQIIAVDGTTARAGSFGGLSGGLSCITYSPDGVEFYGAEGGDEIYQIKVTINGFSGYSSFAGVGNPINGCPVSAGGLLYYTDGVVADPIARAILGNFGATGPVVPVPSLNQTWILGRDGAVPTQTTLLLGVFNNATFGLTQSIRVTASNPGHPVHWGANGIAFIEFNNTGSSSGTGSWIDLFSLPQQ